MDPDDTKYSLKDSSLLIAKIATQQIVSDWRSKLDDLQLEIQQDRNCLESVDMIISIWLIMGISDYICTTYHDEKRQSPMGITSLQKYSEIVLKFPKLSTKSKIKIYSFVWNHIFWRNIIRIHFSVDHLSVFRTDPSSEITPRDPSVNTGEFLLYRSKPLSDIYDKNII